ncbi:MAG: hypothetical protein IKY66_03460 [Bacteroidales bacterium]|nr:hypothetical protein [Bacteroidales bacterium]
MGSTRCPDISFHRNGQIDITARISNAIGIEEGDVIDIAEDRGEYYLYVRVKSAEVVGRHEARCYPTKRGKKGRGRNLRAYSKRLCDFVLSCSGSCDVARVPAGKSEDIPSLGKAINVILGCNL